MAKNPKAESYILLLKAFSSDESEAALAFADLRNSLVRFFQLKGDETPEESADETLDRVAAKLSGGVLIENLTKYSYGVARLIFLENLRHAQKRKQAFEDFQTEKMRQGIDEDADEFAPFRECFDVLPDEEKKILQKYFADLPHQEINELRHKLTVELNVSMNNLRLKIFRLRRRLDDCVRGKRKKII